MFIDMFLLWIIEMFSPSKKEVNYRNNDLEVGAAFFYGTKSFNTEEQEPINSEYDDGPNW
jgi:hypothetical protein